METKSDQLDAPKKQAHGEKDISRFTQLMAAGGYVLIGVSAIMVITLAMKYYGGSQEGLTLSENQSTFSFIIQHFALEILLLIGALIAGNIGLRLLFGANPRSAEVIPEKDRELLEPLIKDAGKEAINQYVVLSSLSGFTGTFQKIGFSGLPLATVTLTLIFSFLSFFNPDFMELAKLTLGAFIGSFVQKGRNQIQMAQKAGSHLATPGV